MNIKFQDLPVIFELGEASLQGAEQGDMMMLYYRIPAGTDMAPLLSGLPEDTCPCSHWGYVLKGSVHIRYKDHEDVVTAGELFHAEPGHIPCFEEDTEMIEFSPRDEWMPVMAIVGRNLAALPSFG